MPYFAPYLDETGLHLPTYRDRPDTLWGASAGFTVDNL